jgi:hypothetical protein
MQCISNVSPSIVFTVTLSEVSVLPYPKPCGVWYFAGFVLVLVQHDLQKQKLLHRWANVCAGNDKESVTLTKRVTFYSPGAIRGAVKYGALMDIPRSIAGL